MKRILLPLAGALLTLGLTGCITVQAPPTQPTQAPASPQISEPTDPQQGTVTDEQFAAFVRENTSLNGTDADIAAAGHHTCTAFDQGATVEQVALSGMDAGIDPYDMGFLVSAAVAAFCPQYQPLIDEFIANNS